MRRQTTVLAVFLFFSLITADFASARWKSLSFKIGLNLANTMGEKYSGQDLETRMKPGLALGLSYKREFSERWSIQPEALVSFKEFFYDAAGWNVMTGETLKDAEFDYRLLYFDIPVLCKYELYSSGRFGINPYAGPILSFFISEHNEKIEMPTDGTNRAFLDDNDVNTLYWGLTAGTEITLRQIGVDFRYTYGLSKFHSDYDLKYSIFTVLLNSN